MSKDGCCYLCNECPASFTSMDLLQNHLGTGAHFHSSVECMDTVVNEKIIDSKMQDRGSVESTASPASPSSILVDSPPFKSQSTNDGGDFSCILCNRKFIDREQLNTHHVHTHRQKPEYVCEVCDMVFSIKREKQTHMRIHSGEMPQKCSECGKEFGTRQLLKKHQMWHTGKRTHVCNECGKAFFQRGHLSQHYQIHKKVRPFACTLCEKTFIFKFDLNRHMKIHAERGYCCTKCGKSFARQAALDDHNCKKPMQKKSIGSPLSDFSQTETIALNSPSTANQQSPSSLVIPSSPGDVKKENQPIVEFPINKIGRMAQLLMTQHQRNLLNTVAQNFLLQQQQAGNSTAPMTSNGNPLNVNLSLASLTPLQLQLLTQQYRQSVQSTFHCSICAITFDSQAAYTLHCARSHFNNGQNNLVSFPTTVDQVMAPGPPTNTLLTQMFSHPKEEHYDNTTTSSSCASSPQKVSPPLRQQQFTEWLPNAGQVSNCPRNHSPSCNKCVETQSKYIELERNYGQALSELDCLKKIVSLFTAPANNLVNL